MSGTRGNIYITSSNENGNRIRQGAEEKFFTDVSTAQFEDARFKQGCDIAISAYRAVKENKISDLEILNITKSCTVIGGVFKYENRDFKVNVFKNVAPSGSISSRTQIFPIKSGNDEQHIEIEFRGTQIASMIESSLNHYLNEILG